jgi:hypothetical protein
MRRALTTYRLRSVSDSFDRIPKKLDTGVTRQHGLSHDDFTSDTINYETDYRISNVLNTTNADSPK